MICLRTSPTFLLLFVPAVFSSAGPAHADEFYREPDEPSVAAASSEGRDAIAGFKIPSGWQAGLFAAEPDVANPVAFDVDHLGHVWVCESFRQGIGVTDNRKHDRAWVDDDLAAQTVADRRAYHIKHLKKKVMEYARYDDRIRLVRDTDGDGRADDAKVFSNRYNHIEDGTGAGVLAVGSDVYFTCIPNLWKLTDEDGDGRADKRTALHSGYGVRVAFRGHDMHGLIVGPDGKLYYSIGDRGYDVTTPGGRLADPASGAVFRCNLDGSQLEVIATGLRNPQELAFDDFGNLFTGDNNSDSGDRARWVYIAEGGDSGWRMHYQYLADRGPFNREKLWHPQHAGQAAYIVPPVCNFADGPSGLMYYPGTGLSEHYNRRFFLCDFRGTPTRSGIRTFRVEPRGAFFAMVDDEQPLWNVLATDIAMGPDGAVYVSDWVNGWNGEGKGRIYRFADQEASQSQVVREVQRLLGGELVRKTNEELELLLGHPDRRVRLQSQFTLVSRRATPLLQQAASSAEMLLGRLHGIWGLGQLLASDAAVADALRPLLRDEEAEVRAQAARVLGDHRIAAAGAELRALLADDQPRVRYFAALSLGQLGDEQAVAPVLQMLIENDNQDPIVRHGGIMALAGIDVAQLGPAFTHPSQAVRLALAVALRKKDSPRIATMLDDEDAGVALEAVRAIHDAPRESALNDRRLLESVAELISEPTQDEARLRRVLNANFRLGGRKHAQRLAAYAANTAAPASMRREAIHMLDVWAEPSPRDRVLGCWNPLGQRDATTAAAVLAGSLEQIMQDAPAPIRVVAVTVAAKLGVSRAAPHLRAMLSDPGQPAKVRSAALGSLAKLDAEGLDALAQKALTDQSAVVRAEAARILAKRNPDLAVASLKNAMRSTSAIERQAALGTLANLKRPAARRAIMAALQEMMAGEAPRETHLDVLEAAAKIADPQARQLLREFDSRRENAAPTAQYAETMFGGDATRGRKIFFEKAAVSCIRCHRIENTGGRVGPNLDERTVHWNKLGVDDKRRYLLESLVEPSRKILDGFQAITIITDEGKLLSGVKTSESESAIQIVTAQAKKLNIAKESIEQMRTSDKSAMPDDVTRALSKRELRDLVEYLATHAAASDDGETEE